MVRYVPHHQPSERDRIGSIFQALADPTRLAVVERLSIGPASTTELARPFDMALPSFIQHLGVLERVGIVSSQKSGRVRVYQLAPDALGLAAAWLGDHQGHWQRRLDQLDAVLLGGAAPTSPSPSPSSFPSLEPSPAQEQAP